MKGIKTFFVIVKKISIFAIMCFITYCLSYLTFGDNEDLYRIMYYFSIIASLTYFWSDFVLTDINKI